METTLAILANNLASLQDLLADEQGRRLLLIGAGVFAMFFVMFSMRRWQQRAQQPRRESPPLFRPQPGEREMQRDLEALMVELQELSRKISAEIDTRFVKLETAIHDADRRIAVLNRLSRGQEAPPLPPVGAPSAGLGNGAVSADVAADTRHQVVYELADAGFNAVEIARDLGKTPGEVELILNLRRKPESARSGLA